MYKRFVRCALLCLFAVSSFASNDYQQHEIDGVAYGVIDANPARVSLHWKDQYGKPYRYLGRLKDTLNAQGHDVAMLMNAGIFSKQLEPAGLWVEKGQVVKPLNTRQGQGNFHIQPNGVFWLANGRAHIHTTAAYRRLGRVKVDFAVQSGPMLLIDGHVNTRFIKGLSSPYKRNAVCLTRKQELRFVMTQEYAREWPSFYRFASALKQLGCVQALYLDGSISDWYVPDVSGVFHWRDFVGMIALTKASQEP